MNIKDIVFHDGEILKLQKISNKLFLEIEICNYLQQDYNDTMKDTKVITLEFENVENYNQESANINDNTIIDFNINNNLYKFKLVNDNNIYYEIQFQASNVIIK